MSEDKRKSHRTQNRFSDESRRKNNGKAKESSKSKQKVPREGKPYLHPECATKEIILKYDENSPYKFEDQLSQKKHTEEIKAVGETELSSSDNGISRILYYPDFLEKCLADSFFDLLNESISWNEENIIIHGIEQPQPRLVSWYGPYPYSYSGLVLQPAEMPESVTDIKTRIQSFLSLNGIKAEFNSVLLNKYRDGHDSVSWHSDDELSMGVYPTIASVSLGTVRCFEMRKKPRLRENNVTKFEKADFKIYLENGSLLIMDGCMQKDWEHRVPKEYHDRGCRINLTFRTVYPLEQCEKEVDLCTRSNKFSNDDTVKNMHEEDILKSIVSNTDETSYCEETAVDCISPSTKTDDIDSCEDESKEATVWNNVSTASCNGNFSNQNVDHEESVQFTSSPNEKLSSEKETNLNVHAAEFVPKCSSIVPTAEFEPKSSTILHSAEFVPKSSTIVHTAEFLPKSLTTDEKVTGEENPCDAIVKHNRTSQNYRYSKSFQENLSSMCEESNECIFENLNFFLNLLDKNINASVFTPRDEQELKLLSRISDNQTVKNQMLIIKRIRQIVFEASCNENMNPRAKPVSKNDHYSYSKRNVAPRHNVHHRSHFKPKNYNDHY